jgi:hypothetical protein
VVELSEAAGWQFGGTIAGHLIGQFPHEKISGDDIAAHIMPGSDLPMRRPDAAGLRCHWILEVHLVDAGRQIGGFHEELLDIGPGSPAWRSAPGRPGCTSMAVSRSDRPSISGYETNR